MRAMGEEAGSLASPEISIEKKITIFNKLAGYLDKSRDCLSGIGCTKRQAYIVNFSLGAALGFIDGFLSVKMRGGKRVLPEIMRKTVLLRSMVYGLGYGSLVKRGVNLFQCLAFRGCDDQTKRFLVYSAGIMGGKFTGILSRIAPELVTTRVDTESTEIIPEKSGDITIEDDAVKTSLGLPEGKDEFSWFEIFGFSQKPSDAEVKKAYKKLSLKYHPDKPGGSKEVMQMLNEAFEQGGFR